MTALEIGLLLVGGAVAGFVNTIAGAGSALTLPLLMLVGQDASVANGTNRIGVVAQSVTAVVAYHAQAVRPWAGALHALPAIVGGAVLGALTATHLSPPTMERLFGGLFLALAATLALRPRWLVPPVTAPGPARPGWRGHAALVAVGIYGGLFQAGVGIPLLLVLVRTLRLDLVRANAAKTSLILAFTAVALVLFQVSGQVEWVPGLLLAAGGLVGSLLGVRATIRRGAALIRQMVLVALLLAAARAFGLLG